MIRFYTVLIFILFISCGKEIDPTDFPFNAQELNYFDEIAFYSEISKKENKPITRWHEDIIFKVEGNTSKENLNLINEVISDINKLGLPISMKISNKNYNSLLIIGDRFSFYEKTKIRLTYQSLGRVNVTYKTFFNKGKIHKASIFISDSIPLSRKKSVIYEELVQSLGLVGDSGTLGKSLFYELDKTITQIPEIDKQMLRILYHPAIKTGMSKEKFREIFKDSLVDYNTDQKIIAFCKKNNIAPRILDTIANNSEVDGMIHLFQNDRICIGSSNKAIFSENFKDNVRALNKISPYINLEFCDTIKNQGVYFEIRDSVGLKKSFNNYTVYHKTNVLKPRRFYAPIIVTIDLNNTKQKRLDTILTSSLIKGISIYKYKKTITDSTFKDYKKMLQLYYSNTIPTNFPAKRLKEISKKYREIL